MANDAIGFEVIINDELLNKVKQADGKLKQLQHTTEQVSKSMIESFKSIGARGLDELIGKVKILNTNIANTNLSNLGGGVTNLGQQATTSIEAIKQLIDSMSKLNQQKVQKLIDDAAYKRVKNDIQEVLVVEKQRKADSKLASEQITTANMRAIAQEKQKQIEIRKSLNEIKRLAKAYKDLPTTLNTKGAGNLVARSLQSTSINQRITSIKNLQNAIKDLDTTDKRYQQTVNKLNSEIARQKQELQKLGVSFNTVKQKSSNLLNISDQLQRRLALVFSVSQVTGYINRLVAVRGEFELQQRSLQAIIGNKDKANEVFDKVTKLAVQSPFQLKDLVTYTKQLAAYKIETNKLYDSTKMLADISAGVGVDMSRMVLAYGQVASANYLRGTELRQFSEAGVNILGGLAEYFTELKGRVVEVDEVFDMVSRRMVRFEHVDEVLRRMTQSGGEFYNMQAIQAQTLKGQVSNLQDSLDVMLNEMGKANEGVLKLMVGVLRDITESWRGISIAITDVGIAIVGIGLMSFVSNLQTAGLSFKLASENGSKFAKVLLNIRDSMRKLFTLIKANPWTAIATGVSVVIATLIKYNNLVNAQNKVYDDNSVALKNQINLIGNLKDKYKEASDNIEKNKSLLQDSKEGTDDFSNAQREIVKSQQEQAKILAKLKSEYPEFYNQIKDNVENQQLWNEALKEYNKEARNQIALQQLMKGNWFDKSYNNQLEEYKEASARLDVAYMNLANSASLAGANLENAFSEGLINEEEYNKLNAIINDFSTAQSREEVLKFAEQHKKTLKELEKEYKGANEWISNFAKDFEQKARLEVSVAEFEYNKETKELQEEFDELIPFMKAEWNRLGLATANTATDEGKKMVASFRDGMFERLNADSDRMKSEVVKKLEEVFKINFEFKIDTSGGDEDLPVVEWVSRTKDELEAIIKQMPKDIKYLNTLMGKDISFKMTLPSDTEEYDEYVKEVQLWINNLIELRKKALNQKEIGKLVNDEELQKIEQAIVLAERYGNVLGIDPKIKKGGSKTDSMLEERLRVLREMYDTYRDLNKTLDETKSKEGVIAKYGDAFKQAFGVDLKDSMFDPSFFINDDEYIKALDKLLNLTADAKEKLKVQLEKGRVEWDIILDAKMASDAKLKENVEKMFSDYSSSIELDKMDISPEFAKAFFDIDTTSLEDLKKKLQEIQPKFTGDDMVKQYEEYLKKVEELETKAQQERLKEYLKYTRDAIGERAKIKFEELRKLREIEKTFAYQEGDTEEVTRSKNLAKQNAIKGVVRDTEEEMQKLEWEAFKSSDTFINLYNDLDNVSNKSLGNMIDMLNKYRDEWSNLPLNEMKEVINLLNKWQEQQEQRKIEANPFTEAINYKQEISDYGGVQKAQDNMIMYEQQQTLYTQQIADLEVINQLLTENEDATEQINAYNEANSTNIVADKQNIQASIALKKIAINNAQKEVQNASKILKANKNLQKSYQQQAEYLGDSFDLAKDLYDAFSDLYEALGGDKDSPVAIFANMGMEMADIIVQQIQLQMQVNATTLAYQAAGVAAESMGYALNSAMGIIGWIVMAIQLIVKLISAIVANHDNQLQAQIETWAEGIEHLQKEYEKLEKVIEHAISFETYRDTLEEMQDNLQQQIKNTQAMIEAEREKKKTDDDQIKEWQEDIEEAQEQIKENMEQFYEDMGGFGSAENYKSAAEDFIDAWYSAFKETGNGLEGLKEQWNEYFDNIIKKQLLMRAGQKYIQPLLEKVDAMLDDGIMESSEMDYLRNMAEETSVGLNEILTNFAEALGEFGLGTGSELEGLSKGIQGVTEVTTQALEAILNSMRLYVIDSNKQLTEIAERVLNFENPQNPILAELKQQTEYIEEIRTFLNSVISRQGSPSIRVSM